MCCLKRPLSLLLIICLGLSGNGGWTAQSLRPVSVSAHVCYSSQALAAQDVAFPYRSLLGKSPRPEILRLCRPNPKNIETKLPDDAGAEKLQQALATYEMEPVRLASTLHDLAGNKDGFLIPENSLAPTAIDDAGDVQPTGFLGLLATPPDPLEMEFVHQQNAFKEHLRSVARTDLRRQDKEISDDVIEKEYQIMLRNFYFVNPGDHHLTFAGIKAGPQFKVKGMGFRRLWKHELARAREITRFRQEMDFEYEGRIGFLSGYTSSIVALLKPKSTEDLSRFLSVKTNYGNRLPVTELAHASIAYVRGLPEPDPQDPDQIRYRVSQRHMRWIEQALQDIETARTSAANTTSPITWTVSELELRASPNIRDRARGIKVPLLTDVTYRALIELGKVRLANAWDIVLADQHELLDGLTDLSTRYLRQLDLARSLIPRLNLRNTRAMLAAIGAEAMPVQSVLRIIRHEQKLHAVPLRRNGVPIIRVTAQHDQPGLFLAISQAFDRSAVYKNQMYRCEVDSSQDPRNARVAFEIQLEKIDDITLIAIAQEIMQIPDIGHAISFWGFIDRAVRVWRRRQEGFVLRTIPISMPLRVRPSGAPSRLTELLKGLRKLDPHASVIGIKLQKREKDIKLEMTVAVPESIADKLGNQMKLVLGGDCKILNEGELNAIGSLDPSTVRLFLESVNPSLQRVLSRQWLKEDYPARCPEAVWLGQKLLQEEYGDTLAVYPRKGEKKGRVHYWLEMEISGKRYYYSATDGQFAMDPVLEQLRKDGKYPEFLRLYHVQGLDHIRWSEMSQNFYQKKGLTHVRSPLLKLKERPVLWAEIQIDGARIKAKAAERTSLLGRSG